MAIDIDFRQDWFWFLHKDQIYYCPEEAQLRRYRDLILEDEAWKPTRRFQFCETFSDKVLGNKVAALTSTLVGFEVDGMGVMIFDSTREVK